MSKKLFLIVAIIILCVSFSFSETWKITSLDWQPYSGSQLANQGNSIQKLRELLKKKNIDLIVEFYPWKRSKELAKKPEYVGYFPAWPEEVDDGFMASDPVDLSELGVITSTEIKHKLKFGSVNDLFKNYKVGYIDTYVYPDDIMDAIKKYPNNADKSPNEMAMMKKISAGRIDAGLTDPNVSIFLADHEGFSNIVAMEKILEVKPLVVSFRNDKDNMERLKILNSLLKK